MHKKQEVQNQQSLRLAKLPSNCAANNSEPQRDNRTPVNGDLSHQRRSTDRNVPYQCFFLPPV